MAAVTLNPDAEVIYNIQPRDSTGHYLEVICRVKQPDPDGQIFSLPVWTPGSYLVRDYARNVLSIEAETDGDQVGIRKLDKSTWRTTAVTGPLIIRMTLYANDVSVRGACVQSSWMFLNGSAIFLRVHGFELRPCVVHLGASDSQQEASWRVATSLRRLTGTTYDIGAFQAECYEDLIDHPILMGELTVGEFEACGISHAIAIAGSHNANIDRLQFDLARICAWHIELFGLPAPIDRYLFLILAVDNTYGGLEHGFSSALMCSRFDLPGEVDAEIKPSYRKFLGLVSHEYFHLWNGKRIKPAELISPDLDGETYTRQLWLVEGITSYYDDLALVRSATITVESYLELLGRSLTAVYRSGGRRRQTLEESSFDSWIKFYKQDENAPNAVVSYYSKGAMVALALDLELRLRSKDTCSLDHVMRTLWQQRDETHTVGLPEGRFAEIVKEVSGLEFGEFFKQGLRSTIDPPVGILLAQFGVRLHLRAADSDSDSGGLPSGRIDGPALWLGINTRISGGRVLVKNALDDGPAQAAGLSAGDEIVAIDGYRTDADSYTLQLNRLVGACPATLHCFRRNELLVLQITPEDRPKDTCYLSLDDDVEDEVLDRRLKWLGG